MCILTALKCIGFEILCIHIAKKYKPKDKRFCACKMCNTHALYTIHSHCIIIKTRMTYIFFEPG